MHSYSEVWAVELTFLPEILTPRLQHRNTCGGERKEGFHNLLIGFIRK